MSFWRTLIEEILIMLVVIALIVTTPFLVQKEWRYQTALKQYSNCEYTEAAATFFSLKKYHHSEELAVLCQDQFYEGINRDYQNNDSFLELYNLLSLTDKKLNKEDVLNYFSNLNSGLDIRHHAGSDDQENSYIWISSKHISSKRILFRRFTVDLKTDLSFMGVGDNMRVYLHFKDDRLTKMEFSFSSCALSPRVFDYMVEQLSSIFGYEPAIGIYRQENSGEMDKLAKWKNRELYFRYPYPFDEVMLSDFFFEQKCASIAFTYECL